MTIFNHVWISNELHYSFFYYNGLSYHRPMNTEATSAVIKYTVSTALLRCSLYNYVAMKSVKQKAPGIFHDITTS